jgi:hypothetical protein
MPELGRIIARLQRELLQRLHRRLLLQRVRRVFVGVGNVLAVEKHPVRGGGRAVYADVRRSGRRRDAAGHPGEQSGELEDVAHVRRRVGQRVDAVGVHIGVQLGALRSKQTGVGRNGNGFRG